MSPKREDAKDEQPEITEGDVARFETFHGRLDKIKTIKFLLAMQRRCIDYC